MLEKGATSAAAQAETATAAVVHTLPKSSSSFYGPCYAALALYTAATVSYGLQGLSRASEASEELLAAY